jgi:hypothetical protein
MWALALVLLGIFIWGTEQIAVMPLQTGEVYPPYSSLRSDPIGTRALYESLARLPELDVSRMYKDKKVFDPQTTLLVLGEDPSGWYQFVPEQTLDGVQALIDKGSRVVIAFLPASKVERPSDSNEQETQARKLVPLKDRWGVELIYHKPSGPVEPGTVPRVSALTLDVSPAWNVLATRAGLPAAAERSFGAGSIVMMTDTYLLSNEGLREARDPQLIARLIGDSRHVVFDEENLGVAEQTGVSALMRKYRLEGALVVLLIAVGLFMWSSASSFLPPRPERFEDAVAGRDAQEGLATLLRRGVPENDLLDICFREWSRAAPPDRIARNVEAAVAQWHGQNPVEAYRAVKQVIAEKR